MQVAILENDRSQAELPAIGPNSLAVIGTFLRAARILCERCSANFEWTTPVASLRLGLHERTGSGRPLFVLRRGYPCAKRDERPPTPEVRYGQTDFTSSVCDDSHAPQRPAHYSKSRSCFVLNHAGPMRCLSGPIERALKRGQLRGHPWQCCVTGSRLGIACVPADRVQPVYDIGSHRRPRLHHSPLTQERSV